MGYGLVGLEGVGMHGEDSRCCRTSNSSWGQSDGRCRHGLAGYWRIVLDTIPWWGWEGYGCAGTEVKN